MISEEEKMAAVKMFCAYCKRTLRNARTDIIRKQAREARWETVFSDMHESELNRLASPDDLISEEVVFEVVGREVVVMDTVLAEASMASPKATKPSSCSTTSQSGRTGASPRSLGALAPRSNSGARRRSSR